MRTREEQVEYSCQQIVQSRGWANLEGWMRGHILEAEARGAAEQRRKDGEGQEPVAWCLVTSDQQIINGIHVEKCHAEDWKHRRASDTLTPLYTHPANVAALEEAEGYLFSNPDTGTEYLPYHPIESGECQYAENIRKATNSELLSELQATWKGWEEDRAGKVALEDRVRELEGALKKADEFITNGIEFGYIRMPDRDTPDSAHETPRIVRAALTRTGTPS